jgi:hypothetical protein
MRAFWRWKESRLAFSSSRRNGKAPEFCELAGTDYSGLAPIFETTSLLQK